MFIEARLVTAVRANAIVVPEDAVVPLQGATFVWVVNDGKAERRSVALGVRTPGFVERSEEHTSELQSQSNIVCRLLLEKKKKHRIVAVRPYIHHRYYQEPARTTIPNDHQ